MAKQVADLFASMSLRDRNFKNGIDRSKRAAHQGTKSMQRSFDSINLKRATLAVTAFAAATIYGMKKVMGSFISAGSEAEQYQVRLKVLLGSAEEGNRLFKDMAEFAGKVPFEYNKIMGAATNLSGVMKGGVDEVKKWMPLIADLAATTGLTIEDTTGQVIRMYSAGAAAADMFRERGVLAMMGFQAGAKYSVEETRKKMFEEWQKADSQFRGATEGLAQTWKGLTSMMADVWFTFRDMVMKAGVFDVLKGKLQTFLDKINEMKESGELEALATKMSDIFINVVNGIELSIKALNELRKGLDTLNKLTPAYWAGKLGGTIAAQLKAPTATMVAQRIPVLPNKAGGKSTGTAGGMKVPGTRKITIGGIDKDNFMEGSRRIAFENDLVLKQLEESNRAFEREMEDTYNSLIITVDDATSQWQRSIENFAHTTRNVLGDTLFDWFRGEIKGISGLMSSLASSIQRSAFRSVADLIVGGTGGMFGKLFSSADGNVFTKPSVTTIAERGAEAVIPLKNGKVPVEMSGSGGGGNIIITGNNFTDPAQLISLAQNAALQAIADSYSENGMMRSMVRG